jgi:hypothetical protein
VAPPVGEEGVAAMIEALVLAGPGQARDASDRLADEARRALEPADSDEVAARRAASVTEATDALPEPAGR